MIVNQWVPAAHKGDAIGDSARRVRGLLREMGHQSDLFALTIDEELVDDVRPFAAAAGIFLLAYAGLVISNAPYLVPRSVTLWQAAAHPASQTFLLIGTVFLLPLVLAYTAFVFWVFRGKVTAETGYH